MTESAIDQSETRPNLSAWQITIFVCCCVVVVSVLSCIAIAIARSNGLTQVTVTALDADAEPRDHGIPLIKKVEALPDYEIVLFLNNGRKITAGAKPNESAIDGLTWKLNEAVAVSQIAGIRLQDQDKMASDVIAEVHITGNTASTPNYKFDFQTERSFAVGVEAFFATPIGMAIAGAFFIAILLIVLSAFAT